MPDQAASPRPTFATDGVHLLRTAQQVQYQLSQMADQKANMVLAATFVIFTVSISQVHNVARPLPLFILGAAAFAAAFLAVLAVLPSVKAPPRPDGPANILFFGSFTQLPEEEFIERLMSVITDPKTVYEAFAHDIYQNGKVLAFKKYLYLGYAYRILLAGLVASLFAFVTPYVLMLLGR
ncbi:Pycsar system effector family protein [Phenylobacterium sp.]|uniref:Pycsar system effector family protein n=1 Tax=Phenylobacterium sp. TaxID=1871053 RepID=UPI0025DE1474|nr:Pycsar system effector family protein [Phenylobacterium sp.]